jgi:hypothetical protein
VERTINQSEIARQDVGMVLTKGDPLNGGDGGDPVADLLAGQLTDPLLNKAVTWTAAMLTDVRGVYQFRSKPGYRGVVLTIPAPVEYDEDDPRKERQARAFKRKYPGTEGMKQVKALTKLVDENGGRQIIFTPVQGKFECHYETDNAAIAAFIRGSDEFKNGRIYEVLAPMRVTLPTGETISVVPADDAARQALAAASA